ncbi:hypothetical protein R2F25_18845 [Streptomyces sp. UP1A-1]|nr:hypothetical protein [Streptomyces sp. UP1A-1]
MTENRRILMVQPYRQLVEKAVAAGFEVWSLWDPALQSEDYLRDVARHSAELLLTDFDDEAALRALIRETALAHDVAHVLHLGRESTMLPAAEEAHALGLALNPPDAVRALNDKAAMRRLLAEHGLSPVRTAVAGHPDEVPGILDGFGYPAVVKPTRLQGSAGVRPAVRPAGAGAVAAGAGRLRLRRSGDRRGVPVRPGVQRGDAQRRRRPPRGRHHREAGHRGTAVRGDRAALPGAAAARRRPARPQSWSPRSWTPPGTASDRPTPRSSSPPTDPASSSPRPGWAATASPT